jgi:ubiquinone biosynthesis O-methyltransferase
VKDDDAPGSPGAETLPAAYAAWRESMLGRITDELERDLILERTGPAAGRRILDVGCGDGVLALELAERGAQVTGVDTSARMIAAARERAKRAGHDVTFEVASAEALPFSPGTYDAVVAITILCFVEDAARTLREICRVLKPGGHLIIGELGKWSTWAAFRRIKGWFGSPVWRHARFRSPPELRQLAAETGLVDVSVTGAIFYPPIGAAARLLGRFDSTIGARTTVGAAFLVLTMAKTDEIRAEAWPPETTHP